MSESEGEQIYVDQLVDIDCPSCGSRLLYSAEHQTLRCNHCGHREDFNRANDQVVERDLASALSQLSHFTPEHHGKKIYDCGGCSAKFALDQDQTRIICAFCGSENVNVEAFDHRFVQPSGVIPFSISASKAKEKFKDWLKRGWFHPSKLKKIASIDGLHGVYIPFWTFDAHTKNRWSGEAGYYYYETVNVYVNGKWESRQVRKIRWVPRAGQFDHFFDDVLVSGSGNMSQAFLDRILPFNLNELVNFDPRLLAGWESEVYSVELNEGWARGEKIMDQQLYHMAAYALGGDTQRNLRIFTQKTNQSFKHIILPIWLASYRYRGKIFRFVVNGQTGKVYGQKPIAWWKIILLVILFISILAAIYFLREYNQSSF